jgi:hypothetical protein
MKYLIDFKNDTTEATIQQYFTAHNITVIRQFDNLGLVYEVSADSLPLTTDIIEYVINDEEAPISLLNRDTVSFDPLVDSNWWKLATLDLNDYDKPTITHKLNEKYLSAYIVDSGITADHPEFVGVNVENVYSYDGTFNDINGHGTAISSIIGGNTCSLANSNIKVVKIFGSTPTRQSHLLAAFDAIISHASTNIFPSVVNLSWAIEKNEFIESKIQKLLDNKIPVVCSAGNAGVAIPNVTPASMVDVLTVGAYNQDFEPCDFSNYTGSGIATTGGTVNYGAIDIWAPGIDILAASNDGSYHIVSGTSIAAAIHSSAILYQMGLELSAVDPERMLSTARLQWLTEIPNYKFQACYRKNILTLQGNYANSINAISTMMSNPEIVNLIAYDIHNTITTGTLYDEVVFYKMYIKSYELEQPLPTGLRFVEGLIDGAVDPSYLEGQDYKLFNTKCNFETILGDTGYTEIKLLVKKDDTIDVTSIDDPEVIVHLQGGPGCINTTLCSEGPCTAPLAKLTCWYYNTKICTCQ